MADVSFDSARTELSDDANAGVSVAAPRLSILPGPVRRLIGRIGRFTLAVLALAVAIALGHLSAQRFVSNGFYLTTDRFGPWEQWHDEGRNNADPYTRAHALSRGTIRLSADVAGVYEARVDADGARLHSSCDYSIEGPNVDGLWWSLSVFDSDGALIDNEAGRHAFTADTAAINPNGSFTITLGRDARHGNWLPTGGAGRIVAVFTLLDPATGLSPEARASRYLYLPTIRSEGCS